MPEVTSSGRTDIHPLIASCVFHYEFEFIHPFADGNGRMGRLWQTLILSRWQPMMAYLPVESLVRERQADYYQALADTDRTSDCTPFVQFMLRALLDTMIEASVVHDRSSEKGSEKSSEKIMVLLRDNTRLSARELAERLALTQRAVEKQLGGLNAAATINYSPAVLGCFGHCTFVRMERSGYGCRAIFGCPHNDAKRG